MRKGWTVRNDTRLRREPDHGAEVLRLLPARTEVEVLDEQPRFTQVRWRDSYLDLTGYIATDFLELEPGEPPEPDPRYAHLLPCPRCGSRNWRVFRLLQSGGQMGGQNLFIPTGFLNSAMVRARVCMRCGYLELCVDQDDLPDLQRLATEEQA